MVAPNVPRHICGMSYHLCIALSSVENPGSLTRVCSVHFQALQHSVAEAEGPAALLTRSWFACRSDARLHKDDTDVCFSKTLNSCKVPQIRYASVERLLERLTDLRFLSIDFLNTFLHTYRIFTTAAVVLAKLSDIYKRPFTSIPVRYCSIADAPKLLAHL